VNDKSEAKLFGFDAHHHHIPVDSKGFGKAFKQLSDQLGFDRELFSATLSKNQQAKVRLWRRVFPKNYAIVDSSIGFEKGIIVSKPVEALIDWDLPADKLNTFDSVELISNEYNQQCFRFLGPVRIGNIEVDELYAHLGKRIDAPILYYSAKLRHDQGDDRSYFNAKESIDNMKRPDDHYELPERAHENVLTWVRDGMRLRLVYWYDSTFAFGYESCYTSLTINNNREYPSLYENEDKLTKSSIQALYVFDKKVVHSRGDYRSDSSIKEKPTLIREMSDGFPCIWINRNKDTVAFAGAKFCQEFDLNQVISLHLQNVYPAKGSGGSSLLLSLEGTEGKQHVMTGEYQDFDEHIGRIEEALSINIIIEKEYADS